MTTYPIPSLSTVLLRGLQCRCPNCGQGRIFWKYLKVADKCSVCGEEFHHHRADDAPAYITMLLVGHTLIPFIAWVEVEYQPSYWVHLALWLPACIILCLGLLQPIKGAVVAFQWHAGMNDFAPAKARRIEQQQNIGES